jgi:hypothetical protein
MELKGRKELTKITKQTHRVYPELLEPSTNKASNKIRLSQKRDLEPKEADI